MKWYDRLPACQLAQLDRLEAYRTDKLTRRVTISKQNQS